MMSLIPRRKMLPLVVAVVAATAVAAWPEGAGAHDHTIPRAKVISRKAWQRGRLKSFCWITGRASTGTACSESTYSWPSRDRTPADKRALVRIKKIQPPDRLKLTRWRRVDNHQNPVGDGKVVNYNLETTTHSGDVVQEARFHLPQKLGHYYLKVKGVWRDTISGENQNATWVFHLKLR
jgi:hypothetical protein